MLRTAMLLAGLLACSGAIAAEGMWTLDNLPKAELKQRYGFTPDAAWVDKVMKSSVRLAGGCSGSFVSADGLVMTNHHCANECIQQLSTAKKDYIADGFLARKRTEEVACPTMELNRLEQISDVTARINQATEGKSGKDYSAAQKAEKSTIESECVGADKEVARCDVVELYQGGVYKLYRYHRFQDVRLVWAPEKDIAFFGGDPDNFNFPRYDLDISLVRAYENGAPAKVKDFFSFSAAGPGDGELAFITGHPGRTQRQLTVAQLERVRDVDMVSRLIRLSEMRGMLAQYASAGGEAARVSQDDFFGVENSFKAIYGQFQALLDPAVFARKQDDERKLRAFARAGKLKENAAAWDEIAAAQATYRNIQERWRQIEAPRAFWSHYFDHARALVRGAEERGKPNPERLREFTEAALPSVTQQLFSNEPIYPAYEKVKLAWSLTKMREWLGADDAFVKGVLGSESPEGMAARMVDRTRLADPALRKQLWEGSAAAVAKSNDPFIELARKVDAEARALRKRYEDEVEAVEKKAAERIARVRFAQSGTGAYPDATFSLRLSYGEVKGWDEKGKAVTPFTTIGGAFDRHTGAQPFALPKSWLNSRAKLNLSQPFNFVTTNDIIGGNSGSPVINRNAEVVGLVFDGNIHSLGGAFWFDERVNRAVSVHSGAILETLRNVYGAPELAAEMAGK
ncbi:MAG: S46 family peptidase [Gammaproteobacteria bacterium]